MKVDVKFWLATFYFVGIVTGILIGYILFGL